MVKKELDERILKKLSEKLSYGEQSIRNAISKIKSDYGVTLNAAAKEYGERNNVKVDRWINGEDQKSWQTIQKNNQPPVIIKKTKTKTQNLKKVKEYIQYETKDRFVLGHIKEVNICCTNGAFTAAFILCRKIVENLIINEIILKKYPSKKDNIPIYFDTKKNQTKNFSEIIQNLHDKKNEFGSEKSILDSLLNKSKIFKDEANKKTHSTYHIVRSLDELNIDTVQDILDLIAKLNEKLTNYL